ncbi:hypothetical protein K439DRAFT_1639015, partial [Ramaria rubella]
MDDFTVACAAALVIMSPQLEPIDKEGTMFRLTNRSESCDIKMMSLDTPVSKLGMRPDTHETATQRKQPLHSKSLYMQRNAHEEFIPHVADLSVKPQVGAETNYVCSSHVSVKVPSLQQVSFAKDLGLSQNLEAEATHKHGQQRMSVSPQERRKARSNYS